jgi:hypothetical protein
MVTVPLLAIVLLHCASRAQGEKVHGVINGRNGSTMTLQTGTGRVTVILNSATQAEDVEGIFHARRKEMSVAALIPGLAVEVEGNYNAQN